MPCEDCNLQFTVFRRKKSCSCCKRYYCSNCLITTSKRISISSLCQRCSIFAKRPLLRTDLLQLKPKDLIFYLQSKHISTSGCVEKDELVNLVLRHVQQLEATSPTNSFHASDADAANHFDSLKQSCQNFFSNITENISDSFAAFEGKSSSKSQRDANQRSRTDTGNGQTHIFDQPRVSTRQIPTYASFQNSYTVHTAASSTTTAPTTTTTTNEQRTTAANRLTNNNNNTTGCRISSSPVVSLSSTSTQPPVNDEGFQEQSSTSPTTPSASVELNRHDIECECSDDELIVAFTEHVAKINENCTSSARMETERVAVSGESSRSAGNSKLDLDASSQSSFEELGAIGGISDDSKTTTDTNSSNVDQWQLLEPQREEAAPHIAENNIKPCDDVDATRSGENLQVAILHIEPQHSFRVSQRAKKVSRRRSDGYLNRRRPATSDEELSPTSALPVPLATQEEQSENETPHTHQPPEDERRPSHTNCQRCGKNKSNIRRYVEKMRCHLESSQMSEADIKNELQLFLAYLEKRMKSVDCSDTETVASSTMSGPPQQATSSTVMDENAGIHVYAAPLDNGNGSNGASRFINLEDFSFLEELDNLTVKQLKEVLMLNRVDYKGCCEKQELLDRVQRLWKNFKTAPAVEKLQTDELCKICMDAPIECVILECGHMATCTGCGKVLSECPICRQYIVRVVRFFRA